MGSEKEFNSRQNGHSSAPKYENVGSGTNNGLIAKLVKLVLKK